MRDKFLYLFKNSLKKKMGSKWFIVVNLILAVALIGIINIDSIITAFGGDFSSKVELLVVDETNDAYSTFKDAITSSKTLLGEDFDVEISLVSKSEAELKESVTGNRKIAILLQEDKENYLSAKVISERYIDAFDNQIISSALLSTKQAIALENSDIDPTELAQISKPMVIDRVILDETKNSEGENMNTIMGSVFPTVILPFFILVIFLVQMIGMEICEEKTTRGMEIIISNVSPKVHFFSKVCAANVFVITQAVLLFLYGALGFFVRSLIGGGGMLGGMTEQLGGIWDSLVSSGIAAQLGYIIPLTIILMLFSFVAYSLVAGILASMTTNMDDFQQIQMPIMIVCLVGYYLAIMAGMFDGSLFIRILSYIPFISCLLSPALLMIGQIGIIDALISLAILLFFIWFMVRYGLRIYKVGILNYSNEKVWLRFRKALKNKDV